MGGELAAGAVVQARAERVQEAAAAVVGAAAAEPDHEAADAAVEQTRDELADAARRAVLDMRAHAVGVGDADDLRDLDHRRACRR